MNHKIDNYLAGQLLEKKEKNKRYAWSQSPSIYLPYTKIGFAVLLTLYLTLFAVYMIIFSRLL